MKNIQWFIEEYYPNYSSSDDIAHEEDLYKLVNNEWEEDDCTYEMLIENYDNNIHNPEIYNNWCSS